MVAKKKRKINMPKTSTRSDLECDVCKKSFSRKNRKESHMLKKHGIVWEKKKKLVPTMDNPRPHKCLLCEKSFVRIRLLQRHRLTKHIGWKCPECNEKFVKLKEHMLTVHNKKLQLPYECYLCKQQYKSKQRIISHMQAIHSSLNQTFRCPLCSEVLKCRDAYRRHRGRHKYERAKFNKRICDICGKVILNHHFRKHMRTHTEGHLKCSYCEKQFRTNASVRLHERTHTQERPYECEVCHSRFIDGSTLRIHRRNHTGESPFLCHLCGRRTKQAQNLASHYRHFHRNSEMTSKMIRFNARVFERYSNEELERCLREEGNLIRLLTLGTVEYNKELDEKNCAKELAEQLKFEEFQKQNAVARIYRKDVIGINVAEPKNESFNLRPIEQINVDGVEAKKSYQTEEHEFPVKCDNEEIEFAEVKVEPTLNVFNETIDFDMSELVATYDIKVEEPFEMDDIINTDGDDELKTDSFFASEASTVHSNNEIKMESTSNEPNAGNVNSEWMQDKATFAELFFCHICNKKYANPSICAKHMLSVHDIKQPDIPRPFKCPSCNLSYGRRSHMWRHYDKQHGTAAERELKKMLKDADSEKIKSAPPPDKAVIEKLSFCHICNVQYANPSVCAKHMLHVHDIEQPDIPRPHKCIMCDNSYGRSSHLWRHYEKKHGNVPDRKMKKLITVMRKREIDYEIVERHCETKSDAVVINEPESDEVFKSVLSHDTNDEPVDVNVDKATMAQLSYCHICDRKYANLGACATHMLDVHQIKLPEIPRSHKCLLCDKSYFKSNHLCRHYVRTHNKTNIKIKIKTDQMHGNASMEIVEPFIDAHSDPIADLENVKIEVAADTETAKASTYCEICEKNYTTRSNFITHMWGVHKIKVAATRSHKCVILTCKKTYKTRNTLLKHYRQDHGGNPECKLKKTERKLKKKKNSTVADVEIESNSEDKKFEMPEDVVSAKARSYCPLCDKRYANHSACATHMLQVHKITMPHIERPYECHVCKKSYVKRGHLTRHLKLGHNIGLKRMGKEADAFECYLCHESFKLREMLKKHASKFHLPIEHSSICPTCGITTRRLGRHIALSHSGTEVKCNVCQRIFSHRSRLTNHMRTHTLPSQCDLCPKRFANNGQMRQHRRYHTQEKPYVCKHCGARFIERSTCTQHERIHTGEKPYRCHLCDRTTIQAGNMKSHYRFFHKMIVKHVSMTKLVTDEEMIPIM